MKKRAITAIVIAVCILVQVDISTPDSALLYRELSADEVNARTDSLVLTFYEHNTVRVDSLLSRYIVDRHPGAAVAVIQDGRIVHKNGYGLANLTTKEPIRPETCFLLASVSKQFTAMAIMILAEENLISLDDTIDTYFPEIPRGWRNITITHLLTHTSGLPDRFWLIGYGEGFLNQDILDRLIEHRLLDHLPGKRFKYSNSGYNLLAMIVEQVSGVPFRVFMEERVFKPLDMDHTVVYDETEPFIENRAVAYRPLRRGFYRRNDFLLYTTGASGVFSSVEDLFKWDQALYSDTLVSRETLEMAFSPQVRSGRQESYGFGWRMTNADGIKSLYHTGTLGGVSNIIFRVPSKGFSVIILSNNSIKSRKLLVRRITEMYHPGLIEETGF
ncbi:serine hydrolase domain-containing protein [candidate division KSB1 bacterium]